MPNIKSAEKRVRQSEKSREKNRSVKSKINTARRPIIEGSLDKEAMKKASPTLMEPIMSVEVVTPEDYVGDVMGDLSSRRGRVDGMEMRANARAIKAFVPLGEMFGYATDLRSKTSGRANYTMQFDHYEPVPKNVADTILGNTDGKK